MDDPEKVHYCWVDRIMTDEAGALHACQDGSNYFEAKLKETKRFICLQVGAKVLEQLVL